MTTDERPPAERLLAAAEELFGERSYNRTAVADICDVCGGKLVARPDDNLDAIRERLTEYRTSTEPTLDLFRKKGLILRIDGTRPADEVYQDLRRQLGLSGK